MAIFAFDDSLSFEENIGAFLSEMDGQDAGMTQILRANFDSFLTAAIGDNNPDQARQDLNAAVIAALDRLDAGDAE